MHEGGVTLHLLNDGALRFVMKDGHTVDSPRPARPGTENGPLAHDILQGDWTHMFATHSAMDIAITPTTAVTLWTGESMDYCTATEALLYETRHAQRPPAAADVSAETPALLTDQRFS